MKINISNSELSESAFENHESWERIRNLAKQALDEMKEELTYPDNIQIDWIMDGELKSAPINLMINELKGLLHAFNLLPVNNTQRRRTLSLRCIEAKALQ